MNRVHRAPVHPDVIVGEDCQTSVKVWQPWIRTVHWTIVGTVVALSVTGYYIGNPVMVVGTRWSLMSLMRTVHYLAAWLFIAALVGRAFLAFSGNPWARWDQLVPVARERRSALKRTVRYYLFMEHEPAEVVGHNPLAGLAYVALFGLFLAQTVTGIALMAVTDHSGWQWTLTGWLNQLLPVATIRLVHHLIMWFTWTFVAFHLYAATLTDRIEQGGEISSMVGGWKILPSLRVHNELRADADRRRRRYTPQARRVR